MSGSKEGEKEYSKCRKGTKLEKVRGRRWDVMEEKRGGRRIKKVKNDVKKKRVERNGKKQKPKRKRRVRQRRRREKRRR